LVYCVLVRCGPQRRFWFLRFGAAEHLWLCLSPHGYAVYGLRSAVTDQWHASTAKTRARSAERDSSRFLTSRQLTTAFCYSIVQLSPCQGSSRSSRNARRPVPNSRACPAWISRCARCPSPQHTRLLRCLPPQLRSHVVEVVLKSAVSACACPWPVARRRCGRYRWCGTGQTE